MKLKRTWHGRWKSTIKFIESYKAAAKLGFSPVETAETVPATDGLRLFIYSETSYVPACFCLQWKDVTRTQEQLYWVKDTPSPVSCLWQWPTLSQKKSSKSSSRERAFISNLGFGCACSSNLTWWLECLLSVQSTIYIAPTLQVAFVGKKRVRFQWKAKWTSFPHWWRKCIGLNLLVTLGLCKWPPGKNLCGCSRCEILWVLWEAEDFPLASFPGESAGDKQQCSSHQAHPSVLEYSAKGELT